MSNLDNLTSKILADAKAQADKIVKDAQEKAQHKYDLEIKRINAKKKLFWKMREEIVNFFLKELNQVPI